MHSGFQSPYKDPYLMECQLGVVGVATNSDQRRISGYRNNTHTLQDTLPETNVAPENGPSQKETSVFLCHPFSGDMLVSGRVPIGQYFGRKLWPAIIILLPWRWTKFTTWKGEPSKGKLQQPAIIFQDIPSLRPTLRTWNQLPSQKERIVFLCHRFSGAKILVSGSVHPPVRKCRAYISF